MCSNVVQHAQNKRDQAPVLPSDCGYFLNHRVRSHAETDGDGLKHAVARALPEL